MTVGLAVLTSWGTVRFDDLMAGSPAFSVDQEVQERVIDAANRAGLTVFRGLFAAAAVISAVCIVPVWMMTARAGKIGRAHNQDRCPTSSH